MTEGIQVYEMNKSLRNPMNPLAMEYEMSAEGLTFYMAQNMVLNINILPLAVQP